MFSMNNASSQWELVETFTNEAVRVAWRSTRELAALQPPHTVNLGAGTSPTHLRYLNSAAMRGWTPSFS